MFFYVDDFTMAGRDRDLEAAKAELMATFEMRDMGTLHYQLGMRFTRDFEAMEITITQDAYIDKMVDTYHIDVGTKKPLVPIQPIRCMTAYTGTASKEQKHLYQRLVGSLLWLSYNTRVDLAFSLRQLSKRLANPSDDHILAA